MNELHWEMRTRAYELAMRRMYVVQLQLKVLRCTESAALLHDIWLVSSKIPQGILPEGFLYEFNLTFLFASSRIYHILYSAEIL